MSLRVPFFAAVLALATTGTAVAQGQMDFAPVLDNTIFSESNTLSDGIGPHMYSGRTNQGDLRRALVAFDIGSIPVGAVITSAALTMHVSQAVGGPQNVVLHRITRGWGEGSSNSGTPGGRGAPAQSGDATWADADFGITAWGTPGGDFATTASASTMVDGNGNYTWTSAALAADVQAWVDGTAPAFGWIVIANETVTRTAKRFDSKDISAAVLRPKLSVTWSTGTATVDLPTAGMLSLQQNWPNPFTESTTLSFTLPGSEAVTMDVMDLLGRRVDRLVSGHLPAGRHDVTFDGGNIPAGIYIARLQVGDQVLTRIMARLE